MEASALSAELKIQLKKRLLYKQEAPSKLTDGAFVMLKRCTAFTIQLPSSPKVNGAHAASGDGSHPGEAANFVRSMRTKLDRGGTACIIVIQNLMRIVLKNNKQCNDIKYFKVIKSRNYF